MPPSSPLPRRWRISLYCGALLLATAIWLPSVHLLFAPPSESFHSTGGVPSLADALARRQLALWTQPEQRQRELSRMRQINAEWDFMGRSFLVWSLANLALREPARQRSCLTAMDAIIAETLRLEREEDLFFFLMPYARNKPFVQQPSRSQFLDSEIALMLATRRLVEEKYDYAPLLIERIRVMVERMQASPSLSAESYPNECWLFCNTVALGAIKLSDTLDRTDHGAFLRAWVENARRKLLDPRTGLLVSTYTLAGEPIYGPEGSSIWMAAHMLSLVDADFARDQFQRARKELFRTFLGFGYAREWPDSWTGTTDVDSGAVLPLLNASIGSSGMALIAASAFDDLPMLSALHATLEFGGFPDEDEAGRHYLASNQVGDAVLLYSAVLGPVFEEVKRREKP